MGTDRKKAFLETETKPDGQGEAENGSYWDRTEFETGNGFGEVRSPRKTDWMDVSPGEGGKACSHADRER